MKATELHALAPIGALVSFTDHKPRPPDRFKKKLAEWERNNASGLFVRATPQDPTRNYDSASFTLQLSTSDILVVCKTFGLRSDELDFSVTLPAPGTIIAYSTYSNGIEASHVWASVEAAKDWGMRKRYDLAACGYKFFRVADGGALADWQPEARV